MVDEATKKFIEEFKLSIEKDLPVKIPDVLSDKTSPINRLKLLIKLYDVDWLGWETPSTLWEQLSKDLNVPDIDINANLRNIKDQIMALKTAILTDSPWEEFDVFENTGCAFNRLPVLFDASQPLSPAQCLYTVLVLNRIRKDDFSDEVQKYIANSFIEEGFVLVPDELSFCQDELDQLGYQDYDFKEKVRMAWQGVKDKKIIPNIEKDDSLEYQLARLHQLKLLIAEKGI